MSYINNLYRVRHARLYPILAGVFERFIPLFEGVLSDLQQPPPRRIAVDWQVSSTWFGEEPDWQDEEAYEKWEETKQITLPEPEPFSMPNPVIPPPAFPLKGRKLHVIVKLANIHLTPEKPEYAGGVWHVEVSSRRSALSALPLTRCWLPQGMQNEAIVASGIYYFAQENIGESKLSFRGTFDGASIAAVCPHVSLRLVEQNPRIRTNRTIRRASSLSGDSTREDPRELARASGTYFSVVQRRFLRPVLQLARDVGWTRHRLSQPLPAPRVALLARRPLQARLPQNPLLLPR